MSVMTPASPAFSYKPFGHDEASTHIRVIQIKQGCGEDIRCVVKHMKRPSGRPESTYSCLSYTWQPENPGRNIYIEGDLVNEGVIEVGKNLGDFLAAARDANVTDWLWIDALCINQQDSAEKEQQVRQMGQTYKHAEKVFIWLGLMDEPTIHAMEKMLGVEKNHPDGTRVVLPRTPRGTWNDLLCEFLSAEYWTRVWIAQEFVLASEPILFFQSFQVSANSLATFVGFGLGNEHLLDFTAIPGWRYLYWQMNSSNHHMNQSASLASLIPKFAKSGCQDKRDRVYALLSLADDGDPGLVNYSISEDVVFRNTMTLMKRHRRPLDELLLIGEALIETLELWPATSPSSSTLEIKFDGLEDITVPIWGCATLETLDKNPEACETIETICMFVGIHDGPNVHVFEYAVDKPAERPIVKYCRAHEYLLGNPPASFVPDSDFFETYVWVENVPSEDLHYFSNTDISNRWLRCWTPQDFEISGLSTDGSTEHGDRDILPALRIVNSKRSTAGLPWETIVTSRIAQPFTTSLKPGSLAETRDYQHDASVPPLARYPRSTTLRLDAAMYVKVKGGGK